MNRTGYIRKHVVRVASDQANGPDHQYQNYGQHHRILGDVLALVFPPQFSQKMSHDPTSSQTHEDGSPQTDLIWFFRPWPIHWQLQSDNVQLVPQFKRPIRKAGRRENFQLGGILPHPFPVVNRFRFAGYSLGLPDPRDG
jgi:hypothetical protein